MKNKLIGLLLVCGALVSCSDQLETDPTDKTTKEVAFSTVEGAYAALNGIYRNFYTTEWSASYQTENFGVASVNICADVMGEDMVVREPGSQWFWYDYRYWVRTEINNTSDRPFVWWNMYYKFINNANYVLAFAPDASGADDIRNSVMAQGYALRAYSYFMLIQLYQRTYVGHENAPGVPLYTEPTDKNTQGKGRGTVEQTYTQINSDLDKAIELFNKGIPQRDKSHIDLYVAYGLKARVAMVQNKWDVARDNAKLARTKKDLRMSETSDLLSGFNDIGKDEWMWGSKIVESQASSWYSFFSHMDAAAGGHANSCRKLASNWLYDMIPAKDVRKGWFKAPLEEDAKLGPEASYNQLKFRVRSKGSWESDYIYMRAAEMLLNEAEASCQLGEYAEAKNLLLELMEKRRDKNEYATYLDGLIQDKLQTLKSTEKKTVSTLMDEILLQRRIELWGEGFRVFDIMRLKSGFSRKYDGSNHSQKVEVTDPESWEWIMMLPIKEFDGNVNMDPDKDQNPE